MKTFKQHIQSIKRPLLVFSFLAAVVMASLWPLAPVAAQNNNNLPTTCDPKATACSPFYNSDEKYKEAQNADRGNTLINKYVKPLVAALSAVAGIAVTGSIIFAGIQYTTAGGDSSKVAAAKQRILKAIAILVAYLFFYQFIKFMLPGAEL